MRRSSRSHHTFVQISLAQDTSWAETHLGRVARITFGGLQPPSPGLATSLGILFVKRSVHRSSYHFPTEAQHVATELQLLAQILPRRNRRSTTYEVLPE